MAKNSIMSSEGDRQAEALGNAVGAFFKGVWAGIKALKENKILLIVFVIITLASGVIFTFRHELAERLITEEGFHVLQILLPGCIALPVLFLYIAGANNKTSEGEFDEMFAQIKFCNKAGMPPKLIKKQAADKMVIYSFKSQGITMQEWKSKKNELEGVLDCNIVKIEPDPNTKQIIKVHTVPASVGLTTNAIWHDKLVRDKDFEIVAGEQMLGEVSFNLDKLPHALIAGVTGSGKSVILRCILWQCISKGAKAFMIDFKGGVEFAAFEDHGEVIADRESALEVLKELTREMRLRLAKFKKTGTKNLPEYNSKFPDRTLCRIVLVCDEISEMLDKTGLAKGDAAIYYEIEKELSSIARMGRAPGINMIFGTQRPDAKVLVGQIKNNLPIRISGRMTDPQASEMVLGNTKATEISGEIKGRFMYNIGSDTYEFQAYNFQDESIKRGDYQKGGMLTEDRYRGSDEAEAENEDGFDENFEYEENLLEDVPDDDYKLI